MVTSICLVTSTRAEYGVLKPLIECLSACPVFCLNLVVMGSHLSPEHGRTIDLIEHDGFLADEQIEMLVSSDTDVGSVKSAGIAMIGLADSLKRLRPKFIILAGDRYEILATAFSASLMGITIIHLHGGEVTIGSQDNNFRHAISKLADYHFVSAVVHKKRLVDMGENEDKVFVVGSLSADTISRVEVLNRRALNEILEFTISDRLVLVVFHPVTNADDLGAGELKALLQALKNQRDCQILFSTPNADQGSKLILRKLQAFCDLQENAFIREPLGQVVFYSVLKQARCILGNSSSGITEAPIIGTPSINVGMRQKGRESASSVMHVNGSEGEISAALNSVLAFDLIERVSQIDDNPYSKVGAAANITTELERIALAAV
jgi:GDP/UDP-N,N'-diacetylbacillosamine 2-epimerase (hydrolysing)